MATVYVTYKKLCKMRNKSDILHSSRKSCFVILRITQVGLLYKKLKFAIERRIFLFR